MSWRTWCVASLGTVIVYKVELNNLKRRRKEGAHKYMQAYSSRQLKVIIEVGDGSGGGGNQPKFCLSPRIPPIFSSPLPFEMTMDALVLIPRGLEATLFPLDILNILQAMCMVGSP